MMKKNGFTLAEVLITLTIIGVVAVLTLPSLITNTQEQQAKTALRKMANTLSNAAATNDALEGFNYTNIIAASDKSKPADKQPAGSMVRLLADRCNIDKSTSAFGHLPKLEVGSSDLDMAIHFNDGTAIYIPSSKLSKDVSTIQLDGEILGFSVIFDTNGIKGPNHVSNCVGTKAGITAWTGDDDGDCTLKSKKAISDQFLMRLRGNQVAPIGAASTWMLTDAVTVSEINKYAGKALSEESTQDNTTK